MTQKTKSHEFYRVLEEEIEEISTTKNMFSAKETLPFVAMIAVEFVQIGLATLSKAALMSGLSKYVYVVYYDALGTIILLPWLACRWISGKRLPLSFSLLCRFFCLSLIGKCLVPICYYTGLNYSSIAVGAAIGNLSPIFTSLLAVSFRMEKLDLRKNTDQIKALGTFVAVLGALIVTLYKGPVLLTHQVSSNSARKLLSEQSNLPLGCLLFTLGVLLKSIWNILQADTAKSYPDEVAIVFFYTLFGAIQTAAASIFLVEGERKWHLHSEIEIIAIIYSVVSLSLFTNTVVTWCLRKKGPIYVSMFSPLNVAIAAIMGFVFLHDGIYLGSVVGSAGIIVGFYAVMWGQTKTTKAIVNDIGVFESDSNQGTASLLQSSHS